MANPAELPRPRNKVNRLRPVQRLRMPRNLQADRVWAFARTLERGVRNEAFRELVQRIDGSPWHALDRVCVYHDGAETFAAIGTAIEQARSEVLVEMYILRDDRVGMKLHRVLSDAAARGVRVCVLADSVGSFGTSRKFWRRLEANGIAVRLFHPWWHSPLHAWRRDHRKIIVIDREVTFTGGMNVGDEYGSSLRKPRGDVVFRDTFVRVDGSIAPEMAYTFADGWARAGGEPLIGIEPNRRPVAHSPASGDDPGALILDARPGRGQPETIAVLAAVVGAAREQLWITTPYFAPPDGGLQILEDAAARGVDVRLLLPGETDVPLVRRAGLGSYTRLLRAGVRIFEYEECVLHAKTMLADNHLSVIGSANLDFRSLWFNAECNLLLSDDATAAMLREHFEADLARSREITWSEWKHRPWYSRLVDLGARSLRVLL